MICRCSLPSLLLKSSGCRYASNVLVAESDPSSLEAWKAAKPLSAMPGPKHYPLLGSTLPYLLKNRNKVRTSMAKDWFNQFGPVVRSTNPSYLGGNIVHSRDPELLQLVAQNEAKTIKYPSRMVAMEENMAWIHRKIKVPPFMFFVVGEEWKKLRSAMAKPITPRRVSMFSPQLYEAANELGSHWSNKRDRDSVVDDIREDLQKWALKGATWFIFNEDLSVFGKASDSNTLSQEFARAGVNFIDGLASVLRVIPLYKIYPTSAYKNYVSAVLSMHSIGGKMMRSRFDQLQKLVQEGEDLLEGGRISVMEHLLIEGKITEQQALSGACDLLAAGVDTTSTTAAFLLNHIANGQDLQQALFDEITSICGLTGTPDFADLQKMSLIRGCVKETLRMYPPSPVLLRTAESDMVVRGYRVPRKTTLIWNLVAMGKDPSIYPNPQNFDPCRWSNKEQESTAVSFANLPFGFGVRMCYGRRLAELELYLLLISLIRRFVLSTDQSWLPTGQVGITKPAVPVKLKLTER